MKGPRQELHTSKTSWMIKQQQQQIQIIHRNGHFTHLLEIQMIFAIDAVISLNLITIYDSIMK